MIGFIVANQEKLNESDKKYYQACYCGLCKTLGKRHKLISRLTLNYDMTFFIVLLSSIYKDKIMTKPCKCKLHPIRIQEELNGEIIDYIADMNIMLAYHDIMDDWYDDKNLISLSYAKLLKKEYKKVFENYKDKCEKMETCLLELTQMEKNNILNPDKAAEYFGEIMGEVIVPYEDEYSERLKEFGKAIGKFIYILDACIDRDKDIKNKKYNPLIKYSKSDFDEILNFLMSDCMDKYKKLEIEQNKELIENILFSGVWLKYNIAKIKEEKRKKKNDTRSV